MATPMLMLNLPMSLSACGMFRAATALVSTITVFDLTGVARRLSTESYTTDALVVAGVVYGVLTLLISAGVHFLERRRKSHAA